jgi:prepilin-type N-terminal cleavage/methylation domain-containing protein
MPKPAGFTLVETLITIVIIGVVSALTIPNLINQCRNAVLKSNFNKAVSTFNEAYRLTLEDLNTTTVENMSSDDFNNEFIPVFLKHVKIVDSYKGSKIHASTDISKIYYITNFSKTTTYNTCLQNNTTSTIYITLSGMAFCFRGGFDNSYVINFDVNYKAKPNRAGYDNFEMVLKNNIEGNNLCGLSRYCTTDSSYPYYNHQSQGRCCSYYAVKDIDPDDGSKSYWRNLK